VFSDAVTTADRIIFFRYMVQSLAQQRGLQATFMPKPFGNLTGNGLHAHMSLWDADTDTNLFEDDSDPRGLGISELGYHFLGGLLHHAKAYIGVTASTVNSYKRLMVGAPTSGATWAPAYIAYGRNNRTQMIRTPAPGRFEDRTIDGAANPYLAASVILAAGLDGIDHKMDPGEPNEGNMYETTTEDRKKRGIEVLPGNLLDAIRNLREDDALRAGLGKVPGGDYIDYFCDVKEREWKDFHEGVSDWEIRKYLSLF
jgi:glutamine synthetase